MFSAIKNIKPHLFFIYAAVFFFIVLNIVTPPLQAADEFNHFYRAYQISEGQFLPNKVDNRLGGEIPNCIKEFVFPFDNSATELKYTLTKKDVFNTFKIPFSNDDKSFKDFPNTSYYSPISYAPQALAIYITKKLQCSLGVIYYSGRLLSILVWLITLFFVIKILPIYKWLFTFIILLPMNLYAANSFSADTVSNILSFLFIALILKHTFSDKNISYKDLLILVFIISLLALAKVVYIGLVLLFLIIPLTKFKNKQQFFLFSGILFLTAFIIAVYWSEQITSKYTPYVNYNPNHRDWICLTKFSNYDAQKTYILNHGLYFLKVIFRTVFYYPYNYLGGYIGTYGNGDIPTPMWLLYISYSLLIFVAVFEKNNFKLNVKQKIIIFTGAFGAFLLLLLSQHLTWDAVGADYVDNLQGRYLIPILPCIFLLLGNYSFKMNINYSLIIISLLLVLYGFGAYKIFKRYYIGSCKEKIEFSSDLEKITENGFFETTTQGIYLEGGASTTTDVAHSGKSSIVLTEQAPFGLTYRFTNFNFGDLIEISVWQKGEGTQLVFASNGGNCKTFNAPTSTTEYRDESGWGLLNLVYLMQDTCNNASVAFYVWNPTKNKTYIDDLKFKFKKFKN